MGYESMLTQGIFYGAADDQARLAPDRLLGDLSGNAFHTGCCAAICLGTVTALVCGPKAGSGATFLVASSSSTIDKNSGVASVDVAADDLEAVWAAAS